jgi:hypothetical protein
VVVGLQLISTGLIAKLCIYLNRRKNAVIGRKDDSDATAARPFGFL